MRVDVVDRRLHAGKSHAHAADSALTRGRDHVVAVRGRAIAGDLGIDACAAGLGVLELFEHEHAGTAGDDEAVAVGVIGARSLSPGSSLNFVDIAPMASNRTDNVQSSSSQPPAKMMSCLPIWMVSIALPMQWLEVAHADEIE